jgi:TolB-like protein/tRNA A-37 threonylcarbamoyl transferase component Bud32/Tfp pilus assembly protein PilF
VNSEAYLDEVAAGILDGTDIDWAAAESDAEADALTIRQLKRLSRIASTYGASAPLWGHLRVLEMLGRGAYGEVYRAWDTRLDREVALKLLPAPPYAEDRTTSLIEEGRLVARVRHPNVATIYGADRIGDQIGLWMELVEGRTLEQLLKQGRKFSVAEVADIGNQIANALDAVHAAGLLHRDVKAQNVIVGTDGRSVLTDFGTGLELSERAVSAAGTPLYLAPEVLNGGQSSVQSDVYALGVLLYRLLTSAYPVVAGSLDGLRAAHASGQIGDVREMRPDTPIRLKRVIERALDPDPARRHSSARVLAADLQRCRGRKRSTWILAAGATLMALGVAAWGTAGDGARKALSPISDDPAIAVLPLENLKQDAGSDWLADGLTDEIISALAAVQGLEVRSRTSSFAFKGKSRQTAHLANQLHVNLLLAGSVTVGGGRVRVNTQLVKVAGDQVLWAETFDRPLEDIPALQRDIARAVADRLRLTLGRGQRRYDTNPVAYEAYLKARALNDRRGGASKEAVQLFERAIDADAAYAPAYAGLANAYAFMSMTGRIQGAEALDRMRPAAVTALKLDPSLAEAHAALGAVYAREHNWEAADQSFRTAIDLNQTLTQFYSNYSFFVLQPLGEYRRAEELIKNALWSDPFSLDLKREQAELEMSMGRYSEAIGHMLEVRNEDPAFPYIANYLLRALTLADRLDEAQALITESEQGRTPGPAPHYVAWTLVKLGRRADAERLARENAESPFRAALIYAALGDLDRAFEAMNRAADTEPQRLPLTLSWPEMRALRHDPRMMALRQRFNLPVP